MRDLIIELRRRNVFRVIGIYAVLGWLLTQMAAVLESAIGLPQWFDGFVVAALLICFPIAILLTYAFELTPEGVKRSPSEPDVEGQPIRKFDLALLGMLGVVSSLIVWQQISRPTAIEAPMADQVLTPVEIASGSISTASIAVLPFVDMSAAGDQEYFGDGIAEEILHLLVQSPALKVAGRTSSFQYKNKNEDLRVIGENLSVAHILEGSVRKAGNELRVTAQLIRTADGFHVWSETYDGNISDIFAVQENIARAITTSLETSLGLGDGAQAEARTENIAAYEHYLRGLGDYAARGPRVSDAIDNFEAAVELDPEFAAAWGGLSLSYLIAPGWLETHDGRVVSRTVYNRKSLFAADRAVELNPNLAVSHHAMGNILMQYWQWERAEDALLRALSIEPNSHVILEDYREFLSKTLRLEEALKVSHRIVELEPDNLSYLLLEIQAEVTVGNYETALEKIDHVFEVTPVDPDDSLFEYLLNLTSALMIELGRVDEAFEYIANCRKCSASDKANVTALLEQFENPDPEFTLKALPFDAWRYYKIKLGDRDLFFDEVEENYSRGRTNPFYDMAYNFGNISTDPRFKAIVEDAGLVRYWRTRGWPDRCRPLEGNEFECGKPGSSN